MKKAIKTRLMLSSLSVFRGIMSRSVVKAYYKLLISSDSKPDDFLSAYGEFYSLISERGFSENFAYAMTEAALFDENIFTRAAAAGNYKALPDEVLKAVKRDCEIIISSASLRADDIIGEYKYYDDIAEISKSLPRWSFGTVVPSFIGFDGSLENIARYYKENGCGIYARYKAFVWRDGDIKPVEHSDCVDMSSFIGYKRQREQVINNTKAFIEGKSCNNCLLYGDMGTGKSSTVKAIANEFRKDGLRIVEIPKERLVEFPLLAEKIAKLPMKFIIFIDDLSFQKQDRSYTTLKAVLEGGLAAKPDNALIYATSNRRHLVKESLADRSFDDDINTRDNMQETLSLSDRFGLTVCYSVPSKKEFINIAVALARKKGITLNEDELAVKAERFALSRSGRSPRCAKQFVESLFVDKSKS